MRCIEVFVFLRISAKLVWCVDELGTWINHDNAKTFSEDKVIYCAKQMN